MKKKRLRRWLIFLGVIALIPTTLFIFDSNKLQVTEYEIITDKLPLPFDGFKIVQVSDYHNEAIEYANANIIDTIIAQSPDIIVLTGDFIDEYTKNLDRITQFIDGLSSIPIYFENGNHDIRAPLYTDLLTLFEDRGVVDLSGKAQRIELGGHWLSLFGVEQTEVDDHWGPWNMNIDPVLAPHLTPLLEETDEYRILLSHHPDFYSEAETLGFDLMLSGHYHGGHIRLFDWSPINWLDEKFGGGHFMINDMDLIVSRGAGSGFFPIRINADAEIVIITLSHP